MKEITDSQRFYRSSKTVGPKLSDIKPQSDLPLRRMGHSQQSAVVPLGKDGHLREHYINYFGGTRFGRVLEDLDFFSVWVALSHCVDVNEPGIKFPYLLVTALVDRIMLTGHRVSPDIDIYLHGQVTWVGQSSMEISLRLEQALDKADSETVKKLDARFVFVARDASGNSKAFVNQLELETDEEKRIFRAAEERTQQRKKALGQSLLKIPPNENERRLIHELFLKTLDPHSSSFTVRKKPPNSVWMTDTWLKNIILCHPDKRNLHNKIFGGYLMRLAFDLAWTGVMIHCKARPTIIAIDDIVFRRPVEIGSILMLTSKIVYVEQNKIQVRVHASVVRDGTFETTNIFQFTFQTDKAPMAVLPMTYSEAMLYLDGKRHFDLYTQSIVT